MEISVFFEDSPINSKSDIYIQNQPQWQREILERFIFELQTKGSIDHPDARKLQNGRWSLWIRRNGEEAVNHVCFTGRADEKNLSDFARNLLDSRLKPNSLLKAAAIKKLVVCGVDRHSISIGKAEEHLEILYFASLMDAVKRDAFLETVEKIKSNIPSSDYSINSDSIISVHINRPELGYGVHLNCQMKWI